MIDTSIIIKCFMKVFYIRRVKEIYTIKCLVHDTVHVNREMYYNNVLCLDVLVGHCLGGFHVMKPNHVETGQRMSNKFTVEAYITMVPLVTLR